jgi:hypothetical protein
MLHSMNLTQASSGGCSLHRPFAHYSSNLTVCNAGHTMGYSTQNSLIQTFTHIIGPYIHIYALILDTHT